MSLFHIFLLGHVFICCTINGFERGKKPCTKRVFRQEFWLLNCSSRWFCLGFSLNFSPLLIMKHLPSSFPQSAVEGSGSLSQGERGRGALCPQPTTPFRSVRHPDMRLARVACFWAPRPPSQVPFYFL